MQAMDFDIHAGKDLDDEGFQLTHPDLNNTERSQAMDATKIKVGDKVRLRNGETRTVTKVDVTGVDHYSVNVSWEGYGSAYTRDGFYWEDDEDPRDIVEILPAETSEDALPNPCLEVRSRRWSPSRDDIVVKPSHYTQFKIEPVTFVMENRLSFEIGNIVKYACRAGDKLYPGQDYTQSRITDLRKVMRYAEMEINRLEGKDVL